MKKLICLVLCVLLLTGMAYADTTGGEKLGDGGSSKVRATMTVTTPAPLPEDVVEVVVEWGDMQFSYEEDGSIKAVDGSNTVTVTNNSNVDVTVTCSLDNYATGISGTVDGAADSADVNLVALAEGGTAETHTFTVEFEAGDNFNLADYVEPATEETTVDITLADVTVSVAAVTKE